MNNAGAQRRRSRGNTVSSAIVIAVLLLAGCGGEEPVVGLELELLIEQQDNFLGRLVRISGVVRMHESPRHFWLEDDALNRVGLVPADEAQAWLGEEVEVVGRFGFAADTGRTVQVRNISARALDTARP